MVSGLPFIFTPSDTYTRALMVYAHSLQHFYHTPSPSLPHACTFSPSPSRQCWLSADAERDRDLERDRDTLRSGTGVTERERERERERDTERAGASLRASDCFLTGEPLGERERLRERLERERFLLRLRLWDLERERGERDRE